MAKTDTEKQTKVGQAAGLEPLDVTKLHITNKAHVREIQEEVRSGVRTIDQAEVGLDELEFADMLELQRAQRPDIIARKHSKPDLSRKPVGLLRRNSA